MAKDKVTVDVKVDDKGSTKKVGLGAAGAADGLDRMGRAAQTTDRRLKGAAQTSANSTKNNAKMMQGISSGLVPAYATLAANVFALTAAFNFLKNAADVANLRKSQTAFAASTGIAMRGLTTRLQEAANGMLSFKEAAAATAIGVAKGFSPKQMEDLAVGAQKAASALGLGFEDAFDRLVRGASKAEPELLDELGITLRLETATKRYGAAIGKNADDLTSYERSQAVLVETQRQLNETFGDAEAIQNPFVQLQKTFGEIVRQITALFLPAFTLLADFLQKNAKVAAAVFGLIGLSIINSIPGIQALTAKIGDFGKSASLDVLGGIAEWKEYNLQLQQTKQTLEKVKAAATKKTVGIAKQLVEGGSKSKTVQKLASGEKLGKKDTKALQTALDRAEAQYKKHGKVVSGIFKGEDIKRLKHFKRSFEQMNREGRTVFQTIAAGARKSIRFFKLMGKGIKAGIVAPYRLATKVAKGAAKAFSMAAKATVILGIVGTILSGLEAMSKAPATVVTNFISMISSVAMGLQWGLNTIAKAINGMAKKLPAWAQKMLGIDGKDNELITPFTFGDEAMKGLTDLANTYLPMEEWAKSEAENKKITSMSERLEGLSSVAKEVGVDLQNVLIGLKRAEGAVKKDLIKSTFLSTMNIADLVAKVMAEKLDPAAQQAALKDLVTQLDAANLSLLGPVGSQIVQLIEDGNDDALNKIEIANRDFVGKTSSFKNALNALTSLNEKSMPEQLEFIESLRDEGVELVNTAKNLERHTDAQEKMDELFTSFGGLETYTDTIRDAADEAERLDKLMRSIKNSMAANEASFLPKNVTQFVNNELKIKAEIAKRSRLQLDLEAAQRTQQAKVENELNSPDKTLDQLNEAISVIESSIAAQDISVTKVKKNLTTIGRLSTTVSDGIGAGFADAFEGLINGTLKVKDAFRNMAAGILKQMARIIAEALAAKLILAAMGMIGNIGATKMTGPSPTKPDVSKMTKVSSRYGGIKEPRGYRAGGIAQGRDAGYPAILHGTEAVVPIGQNKKIPVEMVNGGSTGTQNNVTISVTMDSSGSKSDSSSDSQQGQDIGAAISQAVQKELQYQKRSGGILNPYGVA
jgi:hypothetical protein